MKPPPKFRALLLYIDEEGEPRYTLQGKIFCWWGNIGLSPSSYSLEEAGEIIGQLNSGAIPEII